MNLLNKLFKKPPKKEPTTLEVMETLGFVKLEGYKDSWVHETFGWLVLDENTPVKEIAKVIHDSGYESANDFSEKFRHILEEVGQGRPVTIYP
jgi:hypothetical protein